MLPERVSPFKSEANRASFFDIEEDSQGKQKESLPKARIAALWASFFIAACIGFSVSQFTYIYVRKHPGLWSCPERTLDTSFLPDQSDRILLSTDPPRNELERLLRQIAPQQGERPAEVLIALCTSNLVQEGLLTMFLDTLLQSGVPNYLIVALDEETQKYMSEKGLNVYLHKLEDLQISNHAVSARKYRVIQAFLELGWNVFLSDIDVVVLKNPFDHLARDHDIEAMSDGFDDESSYGGFYGVDDESMGWARFAQGFQHLALNSGLFYIKASRSSLRLTRQVAKSLEDNSNQWDQAVFNREIFALSHGAYVNPGCTVRVLERERFMNSKVLFKQFRHKPRSQIVGQHAPIMLHMNYHPNKGERMKAAIDFFLKGDSKALEGFPGGSEPGT